MNPQPPKAEHTPAILSTAEEITAWFWGRKTNSDEGREVVNLMADKLKMLTYHVSANHHTALQASHAELVAALSAVVRVASRKTDEFDAARTALANAQRLTK